MFVLVFNLYDPVNVVPLIDIVARVMLVEKLLELAFKTIDVAPVLKSSCPATAK